VQPQERFLIEVLEQSLVTANMAAGKVDREFQFPKDKLGSLGVGPQPQGLVAGSEEAGRLARVSL